MKKKTMLVLASVALVAIAISPFAHSFASLTIYGYTDKAGYKPGETGTLNIWVYNDGTEDLILYNVTVFYPWHSVIWGGNVTIDPVEDVVIKPQGNWTTSLDFTIPNDGRATSGGMNINVVTDKLSESRSIFLNVASTSGVVAFEGMDNLQMSLTFMIIITLICTVIIAAAIFLSARRPQVTWKAEQGQ